MTTERSVQRGEAPLPRVWGYPTTLLFSSAKNGGQRGLISCFREAMPAGFALLYPPYYFMTSRHVESVGQGIRTPSAQRRTGAAA